MLKDPEPSVLFNEFGDSSLNFRVLYWIPVEYGIASKSAISIAIYNKLKEAGITIPFPQRDVHVIQDTPPMGVVLPTKDKDA